MNDDLYTLKVACYFIKDLKEDERKYNVALVKTAGQKLLEKKGWLGQALGIGATLAGAAYVAKNGPSMANSFGRTINYFDPNSYQDSVIHYANNSGMTPEERNLYLIRRLSGARNYQAARNRADSFMNANREIAYRNYKSWDAQSRANRAMQQSVNNARAVYANVMGGGSGYGYMPGGSYSMYRYV